MLPVKEETGQERYWGITLPARQEALFPEFEEEVVEEVVEENGDDDLERTPLRLLNPDQGFEFHSNENCLACFQLLKEEESGPGSRGRNRSSSLTCPVVVKELDVEALGSKSTKGSPSNLRKQIMLQAVLQSSNSIESVSGGSRDNLVVDRVQQRKEILRLISAMSAMVGIKTAEEGLLRIREHTPGLFKDLCLYSEVCQLMTHCAFRLTARQFIQELFMDVSFEALAEEPRKILAKADMTSKQPLDDVSLELVSEAGETTLVSPVPQEKQQNSNQSS